MNNYDMEANSREELLISFKEAYGNSMKFVQKIVEKFCVEKSEQEIEDFIYIFFPFMFGIYPYTSVTDKQKMQWNKLVLFIDIKVFLTLPIRVC